MIRHVGALFAPLPVVALAVAMIQPSFRAALMTLIGPPTVFVPKLKEVRVSEEVLHCIMLHFPNWPPPYTLRKVAGAPNW
jgi:hypothetical protein